MLLKPKDQKKRPNNRSDHYKAKALRLWYKWMHLAKRACLIDGCAGGDLEAHHLITKAQEITRNDPENGVMLCSFHHRGSLLLSAHNGTFQFKRHLKKHYPDKHKYLYTNQHRPGRADFKSDCELLQELIDNFN